MAQQTQISRVEPAWEAFLARFPTVSSLAAASAADVLRAWQGMGYNRRALNLRRAARVVVAEHDGVFPDDLEALLQLPGVGPYTARAVAAIAYGRAVGAVDTNVRRVLGRVVAGAAGGLTAAEMQRLADNLVPAGRAGEWTHALMDIGASFCRSRAPRCGECPLAALCRFARASAQGHPSLEAHTPVARSAREATSQRPPFRSTSRWLRGRLLDRARATPDEAWFSTHVAIEPHDTRAVAATARTLAGEGLLELHPSDPGLARLPR